MSISIRWQRRWLMLGIAFLIQAISSAPLTAAAPSDPSGDLQERKADLVQTVALQPFPAHDEASEVLSDEQLEFQRRVEEARALLAEFKRIADIAQHALHMEGRIKALRRDNARLKRRIRRDRDDARRLRQGLISMRDDAATMTAEIVRNWLLDVNHADQLAVDQDRLSSAEHAWQETTAKLAALRHRADQQRERLQSLRARKAALAAEIGRTRREIVNLEATSRLADHDRLTIDLDSAQLRHDVAAWLRTILVVH